jgi:hypothetical protein
VPPETFVLVPIAGMATGAMFMFGIYKLVMRWMDLRHRREVPAGVDEELEELRNQVGELRDLAGRVMEIEERLDFAERLLAQARTRDEAAELGPGGR